MRRARVSTHGRRAGVLWELEPRKLYRFVYDAEYDGPPISLVLPVSDQTFEFSGFPPFFDGLLPEGPQLDALCRLRKLDRDDAFGQLMAVGLDVVGAVTIEEELP